MIEHRGTSGRAYGGDPALVHIPDHHRTDVGRALADCLEMQMRLIGTLGVGHEPKPYDDASPLCPGCYMIALFDAAVFMARRQGQDVRELGLSLGGLFTTLAHDPNFQPTEEMVIVIGELRSNPQREDCPECEADIAKL